MASYQNCQPATFRTSDNIKSNWTSRGRYAVSSLQRPNQFVAELNRVHARAGQGLNKLRTYRTFKELFQTEHYVKTIDIRARLETGRYERGRYTSPTPQWFVGVVTLSKLGSALTGNIAKLSVPPEARTYPGPVLGAEL